MPDAIIESEDSGSQGIELYGSIRAIIDTQLIRGLGKPHQNTGDKTEDVSCGNLAGPNLIDEIVERGNISCNYLVTGQR